MARAWLSLGSNLDPARNLDAAIAALDRDFHLLAVSPTYRSAAEGFEGPEFLNLAALLETGYAREALEFRLRELEEQLGRDRSDPRLGSRVIDIDLILYERRDEGSIRPMELVRDELHRPFVLCPLSDLSPDLVATWTDHRTLRQRWLDLPLEARQSVQVEPRHPHAAEQESSV